MTDNSTTMPPQPPPHLGHDAKPLQLPEAPTPSKSIQRTKTMRNNLGQAGNKMRGLFKKQGTKEIKENSAPTPQQQREELLRTHSSASSQRSWDRPLDGVMEGSVENTGRSDDSLNVRPSSAVAPSRDTMPTTAAATTRSTEESQRLIDTSIPEEFVNGSEPMTPEIEELLRELEQVNNTIVRVQQEVITEAEKKKALQLQLEETRRQIQTQEQEYAQIEQNFFQHTRAIRATDDDLSTIRDSFKLLKYSIARLVMTLNKKADRAKATAKFVAAWPHLKVLEENNNNGEGEKTIEPSHINLLAEKLVHEHLLQHVFRCPLYPGLEINSAYASVTEWLTKHGSDFPIRLRQQLAAIIAKSDKDSELQQAAQAEKQKVVELIYNDLADVYHPFIRENDASVSEEKRYLAKVTDIVDKAMKLAIAIRGQEVDIDILDTKEGEQAFDEETMVDVKGRTSGTVRFCICPPFVGGDGEHGFLEKGKVVIG